LWTKHQEGFYKIDNSMMLRYSELYSKGVQEIMLELWDIYDKNRNKTGRIHERVKPLLKGDYHLVVYIWIINNKDEVLLTKRHPDKPWGNYWECTGGSVTVGEDSLQGALREVAEEIGVILNGEDGMLLSKERREHDFVDTWLFKKDFALNNITFQPEEVIDAKWVNKNEYNEMYNEGMIVPTLKNFYELYPCEIRGNI
jgi:8-oxo-dGTP diphosphatase